MTNEEIRNELKTIRKATVNEAECILRLCRIIEALLDRADPDVDALIEKQRDA